MVPPHGTRGPSGFGPHRTAAAYYDALALNDTHALLTRPARPASHDALCDIASILALANRPLWPSRIITVVEDDPHSLPAARIASHGTQVFIRPNGPGLLIQVSPLGQPGAEALEIAIAGPALPQQLPREGRP